MLIKEVIYFTTCPNNKSIEACIHIKYDVSEDPELRIGKFWRYTCDTQETWNKFAESKYKGKIPPACQTKTCNFAFPETWDFAKGNILK
ncbi:MAG: hypothetical protein NC311_15255 [Muribaculaceae bacterium]|nr:hypothetical protein [Muribaculaceae bacterium]